MQSHGSQVWREFQQANVAVWTKKTDDRDQTFEFDICLPKGF